MPDSLNFFIWAYAVVLYVAVPIACVAYMSKNPTDEGRPWVRTPGEALLFAVFIAAWPVVWPALLITAKLNARKK
jgi:hypothetical protein